MGSHMIVLGSTSCLCSLLSKLRYQSLNARGTSPLSREGDRHSGGSTILISRGSAQRSCIIPIRFHRCKHLGMFPVDPTGWLSCTISVSLAFRSRGQMATETPTSSYVPHSNGPCGRALVLKTLHTEVAYPASGKTLKRRKTASRCPNRTSCRPSKSLEGIFVSQYPSRKRAGPAISLCPLLLSPTLQGGRDV